MVLDRVKKEKISTYALLLECQPAKVENQKIVLSFNDGASFHCREIEKAQSQTLIRKALKEILGANLGVSCVLSGSLAASEPEIVISGEKETAATIDEILSKPHIVQLVQDSFEAEVIDEVDLE